jgi:uncharacterized protein involved in tolerance to divalent cations
MAPDTEHLIVFVTVPAGELGRDIGTRLVEESLAACVNKFKVDSIYWWEGKIENDEEELLAIKTTKAAFDRLKDRVVELHPYDVPEIIAFPITCGHMPYLDWITATLSRGSNEDAEQS